MCVDRDVLTTTDLLPVGREDCNLYSSRAGYPRDRLSQWI